MREREGGKGREGEGGREREIVSSIRTKICDVYNNNYRSLSNTTYAN